MRVSRFTSGAAFVGFLLLAAELAAAQTAPPPASALQDLHSLDELREAFNRDAGKTRLILLLSPT